MTNSWLSPLFFLSIFWKIMVVSVHGQCKLDQKTYLLELKSELMFNSSDSQKLVLWNVTDDCCSWEGVECDEAGHVVSLFLDDEAISGGIDESSSLFAFRYLKYLTLANNKFNSTQIPSGIHRLKYLVHLDLSNAGFTGPIPPTLGNLTELVFLDLSRNHLFGSISHVPFEALSILTNLILESNSLSGNIPRSLFGLPSLGLLDLSNNQLDGQISQSSDVNISNISYLDLSDNSLSGSISLFMCNMPSLWYLILSNNQFSGKIAESPYANISRVELLDLSHNAFGGSFPLFLFGLPHTNSLLLSNNQFSGKVDEFPIVNVSILEHLDLNYNSLSGMIPFSLFQLPSLGSLQLSNNQFSEFPNNSGCEKFCDFIKQCPVEILDLSKNRIVGEIPSWIWEIKLNQLNLSYNMLVGLQKPYHIPDSLRFLDLHSNMLRGELPLPTCLYVDLSSNKFDNFIPPDLGNFARVYMSLANNSLTGAIPISLCNASDLLVLDLSFNDLTGTIPPCLFKNALQIGVLNLRSNNISGDIPDIFPVNCSLQTLNLGENNLGGRIPKSLELCKQLEVMNVGGNNMDDSFPCMLPASLRVLVLRSNRFHGEIKCFKRWPNLQIIDVAYNSFSGSLHPVNFSSWRGMMLERDTESKQNYVGYTPYYPDMGYQDEVTLIIKGVELQLAKIRVDFTSIDFSSNNFHGEIPDSIGDLHSLYLLNLSHNTLSGNIPNSCGNLTLLGSLDLSINRLTGMIPQELAQLTFLSVLNLSYNNLVGVIPSGRQFQTFSADSFRGNPGLIGFPLNNTSDLSPPPAENAKNIEWGYVFGALGYVVGLGSIVWLLLFCQSFREKYFGKVDEIAEQMFNGRNQRRRRRQAGPRVVTIQGRRQ